MKIISWNVNGIRAVVKKGFLKFINNNQPDIVCLQEIKISNKDIARKEFDFPGYIEFWHSAERPGYSGTAMLVKTSPHTPLLIKRGEQKGRGVVNGFGVEKFDREGRVQTIDLKKFYLVNAYFPNANHELSRLGYKLEFNNELLKYIKKLEKVKPIILTGDYNVAHEEIDLARPKDNIGNPGFTNEERAWMTKFLNAGFVDIWREQNPKKIQYTWWGYRFNARTKNIGWRIDYFCASAKMKNQIKSSYILDKVVGSDHCPIGIEF